MDPDRSWGAVVIDGSVRFLLVHHASGNHWDHPKGHSENRESARETALREIREEGGITAEIIEGFESEAGWILPDGRRKQVVYFLARRTGDCAPEGPRGEILGIKWLNYQNAREQITYESGKQVLDEARRFLEQLGSGTAAGDEVSGHFQ